jgi:hypothetical protein
LRSRCTQRRNVADDGNDDSGTELGGEEVVWELGHGPEVVTVAKVCSDPLLK